MTPIPKQRLDRRLVELELVRTRSQAESYIRLGDVTVDGHVITKPGYLVAESAHLNVTTPEQYVSRAALKLASVTQALNVSFTDAVVLDVGSSTGGFTDYALRHDARRVVAIEVGSDQLHPSLRGNPQIELHEKTDIRDVYLANNVPKTAPESKVVLDTAPDIIVADVSFISLREILPHLAQLSSAKTQIVAMLKPQFETGHKQITHKGVIKNDSLRREILRDFESWAQQRFVIINKADSAVAGAKGNRERFYLLKRIRGSLQTTGK